MVTDVVVVYVETDYLCYDEKQLLAWSVVCITWIIPLPDDKFQTLPN